MHPISCNILNFCYMNKLFTLFLVLATSVGAVSAEPIQIGKIYYHFDDNAMTASVAGADDIGDSKRLLVPATVGYNDRSYTVTSIENCAIQGKYFDYVTLPSTIVSIGDQAFASSTVHEIHLEEGLQTIGADAFMGCTVLEIINIPSTVTSIGHDAFKDCTFLPVTDNIHYADNYLVAVEKEHRNETSYTIKPGTKWIGDGAFQVCWYFDSIVIPEGVEVIGHDAFEGTSLKSVSISSTVTTIGNTAFMYCSHLTSVLCEAVTPPTCGIEVFKDVPDTIPLYVPASSVEAYKTADTWKDFKTIKAIQGGVHAIDQVGQETKVKSQKLIRNGQLFIRKNDQLYTPTGQEIK